jgi:hypothetical protein
VIAFINRGEIKDGVVENEFEHLYAGLRRILETLTTGAAGDEIRSVSLTIDGAGSAITTGIKGFIVVPASGIITKVSILSTDPAVTSGSIVIDIWKADYASYPPTVANSICASAKPTISGGIKSQDELLTGWTTEITAGDVLGFKVDSVTSLKRITMIIEIA